jgi:hypothetical protein
MEVKFSHVGRIAVRRARVEEDNGGETRGTGETWG